MTKLTVDPIPCQEQNVPEVDSTFETTGPLPPLIPEGVYSVMYRSHERRKMFEREMLMLTFEVIEAGDFHGTKLFMIANLPKNGRWSVGSKFVQCWIVAQGKRPDRYDRLNPSVFKRKAFLAKVATVKKNILGLPRHEAARYSKIQTLISLAAGGGE